MRYTQESSDQHTQRVRIMQRRSFNQAILAASAAIATPGVISSAMAATSGVGPYRKGDSISADVFVLDQDQNRHPLLSILSANDDSQVNLLFLFGGGDMGGNRPGGIWCSDSFNDMHILRALTAKYRDQPVGFIPVACAPVYSTQYLDFPERVFLDFPDDSAEYQKAAEAFISSTQSAVEVGIIPMQPWYDLRLRTMMSRKPAQMPAEPAGEIYAWQGRFRAADETQNYGVPNFWVLDSAGVVLADSFRGNMYHPHGSEMQIKYTLADVDAAIKTALSG
jgi:hypothetical protein